MIVGVPKETFPGESRVALIPGAVPQLTKRGFEVQIEAGAGTGAGFPDSAFEEAGAKVVPSRRELFKAADVILQVRGLGANPDAGKADVALFQEGQVLIAALEPLTARAEAEALAGRGVIAFALELVPRITRAQSMDILSSQANLAGYKAVIIAAESIGKIFPMMMTAAGTIAPAHVFVIGAGVAGLQAIATAKRLGAKISAYDVRPAVREQIHSLGAKFETLGLETVEAEDEGGYAREMEEDFLRRQREGMTRALADSDVVITTAAVPGKPAPVLITREMVEAMRPGSVIIDLAAERGGNCELTLVGRHVEHRGVTIIGPLNLPSRVGQHASQMYSKNISSFLLNMVDKENTFTIDLGDEIVRDSLLTQGGEIVSAQAREVFGLPPLETSAAGTTQTTEGSEN